MKACDQKLSFLLGVSSQPTNHDALRMRATMSDMASGRKEHLGTRHAQGLGDGRSSGRTQRGQGGNGGLSAENPYETQVPERKQWGGGGYPIQKKSHW